MKKIAMVGLVLLLAAGVVYAKEDGVQKKAGEYDVKVSIDRNPPVAGDNNVAIAITGAGGPVKDAKVAVEYSMPAMPGMPPMNYKTDALLKGDLYKAVMNFSRSGSWNVTVRISRGGKAVSTKFTVDAK